MTARSRAREIGGELRSGLPVLYHIGLRQRPGYNESLTMIIAGRRITA